MTANLITVKLKKVEGGWVVATSDELPGLFISYPDERRVIAEIQEAIRTLYKAQFGQDVTVVLLNRPNAPKPTELQDLPYATIPANLLSQASLG